MGCCKNGHPRNASNTLINRHGWRVCRICRRNKKRKFEQTERGRELNREKCRRYYARKKAAPAEISDEELDRRAADLLADVEDQIGQRDRDG